MRAARRHDQLRTSGMFGHGRLHFLLDGNLRPHRTHAAPSGHATRTCPAHRRRFCCPRTAEQAEKDVSDCSHTESLASDFHHSLQQLIQIARAHVCQRARTSAA